MCQMKLKLFLIINNIILQNKGSATFSYTFSDVQEPINFYVEANGIQSQDYQINVIGTPTISNISLQLKYPNYLERRQKLFKILET